MAGLSQRLEYGRPLLPAQAALRRKGENEQHPAQNQPPRKGHIAPVSHRARAHSPRFALILSFPLFIPDKQRIAKGYGSVKRENSTVVLYWTMNWSRIFHN